MKKLHMNGTPYGLQGYVHIHDLIKHQAGMIDNLPIYPSRRLANKVAQGTARIDSSASQDNSCLTSFDETSGDN